MKKTCTVEGCYKHKDLRVVYATYEVTNAEGLQEDGSLPTLWEGLLCPYHRTMVDAVMGAVLPPFLERPKG